MDSNKTRKEEGAWKEQAMRSEEYARSEEIAMKEDRAGKEVGAKGDEYARSEKGMVKEEDTIKKEEAKREEEASGRRKWNYIFSGSFKMALFLPLVILSVEIFILDYWPDVRNRIPELLYDYLFLFSMIFLIFVCYHLLSWKMRNRSTEP